MKEVVVKMQDDDVVAVQRVMYEISSAKAIIGLYVDICNKYNTPEMLGGYIDKYDNILKTAVPHKEILFNEIMNKYFPYDVIADKNDAMYTINAEDGEIKYTYELH